jgi:hypothetical protein
MRHAVCSEAGHRKEIEMAGKSVKNKSKYNPQAEGHVEDARGEDRQRGQEGQPQGRQALSQVSVRDSVLRVLR